MADAVVNDDDRSAPLQSVGLLLIVLAWIFGELRADPPQVDDAFISFRYARNLIEGHGLVYNPGERVEGFTNLLWTLAVAAGGALGAPITSVARGLEFVCTVGLLVATHRLALTCVGRQQARWALAAPLLVLLSPALGTWALAGLGESLYALLVTLALLAEFRARLAWTTALLALATLARPEGALVAAVLFAVRWLQNPQARSSTFGWASAYGAFIVAITLARLAYYGSPVPNTFYAKVGGIPLQAGVAYLTRFLVDGGAPLLLLSAIAVATQRAARPAGLLILAVGAYVLSIGGDVFPHGRFLLPVLPALAALAAGGAARLAKASVVGGAAAGLAVAVAATTMLAVPAIHGRRPAQSIPTPTASQTPAAAESSTPWFARRQVALENLFERRREIYEANRALAGRMRTALGEKEASSIVAAAAIGALGYHSRARILDIFGLTNSVIARSRRIPPKSARMVPGHHRSDPDYVLSLAPDYIVIPRSTARWRAPATIDLSEHPDFVSSYRWDTAVRAWRRVGGGW